VVDEYETFTQPDGSREQAVWPNSHRAGRDRRGCRETAIVDVVDMPSGTRPFGSNDPADEGARWSARSRAAVEFLGRTWDLGIRCIPIPRTPTKENAESNP